jgi:hypothetical protein
MNSGASEEITFVNPGCDILYCSFWPVFQLCQPHCDFVFFGWLFVECVSFSGTHFIHIPDEWIVQPYINCIKNNTTDFEKIYPTKNITVLFSHTHTKKICELLQTQIYIHHSIIPTYYIQPWVDLSIMTG